MRRLVLKAVMMTVVIFGAVNYMAYLQTGRSFFPMWLDKTLARFGSVKQSASEALSSVKEGGTEKAVSQIVYKWTDGDGVLQYTNVPPPEGVSAVIVKVDPNTNLMQAVPVPQSETGTVPVAEASENKETTPAPPEVPFPYRPEQVKKTMEDAQKAQQMMNEKLQKQQQILDSL